MRLRDWLNASSFSVKGFAETIKVERAMVYRYFAGAIPRAQTIRRIELLTNGAVTAQDFYETAMQSGAMHSDALQSGAMPDAAIPDAAIPGGAVMPLAAMPGAAMRNGALALGIRAEPMLTSPAKAPGGLQSADET